MDLTILAQAVADETDKDSTAFYVLGGLLALFAVAVGVFGITRPEWKEGQARAVMGIGAVLVVATAAAAIITT
jgi:hypothetical protein